MIEVFFGPKTKNKVLFGQFYSVKGKNIGLHYWGDHRLSASKCFLTNNNNNNKWQIIIIKTKNGYWNKLQGREEGGNNNSG